MHKPSEVQIVERYFAFITLSVQVVVPDTRMVCVWAMWECGQLRLNVSAVVALETRHASSYTVVGREPDGDAPDHAGMITLGWTYDGEVIFRQAQIVDPEDDCLIVTANEAFCRHGSHYKLVVADWPRAQDDERLQDTLDDVKRAASADGPGDDDDGD